MRSQFILITSSLFLALIFQPRFAAAEASNKEAVLSMHQLEKQQLLEKVKLPHPESLGAIRYLQWAGYSDPEIFFPLRRRLEEALRTSQQKNWNNIETRKEAIDALSWEIKALSYSGDMQHRLLLERLVKEHPSSTVQKRALRAIKMLDQYNKWNPIILEGVEKASTQRQLITLRMSNMLGADEWELNRAAAKRIYFQFHDDKRLTDKVDRRLRERLQEGVPKRGMYYDTISWLCKVLGRTKDKRYEPTIRAVLAADFSAMATASAEQALTVLSAP